MALCLLPTDDAGVGQLIHDPGGTVEADLQKTLQHTDRSFVFLDDETACPFKILIDITFTGTVRGTYALGLADLTSISALPWETPFSCVRNSTTSLTSVSDTKAPCTRAGF